MNDQDHYSVLGVSPEASTDQIKDRYRYLAHAYHPDKFSSEDHRRVAEEDFKRINEAYQILADPLQRADFDQKRQSAQLPPEDPQTEVPPPEADYAVETVADMGRRRLGLVAGLVSIFVLAGCGVWYWGFHVPAARARIQALEQQQRDPQEAGVETEQEQAAAKAEQEGRTVAVSKADEDRKAEASRQAAPQQPLFVEPEVNHGRPLVNSLGMRFVPVSGIKVLFSVWETRVRDYRVFFRATSGTDRTWETNTFRGVKIAPSEDCPVGMISWNRARQFCEWLTKKERQEGRISATQSYRLPTDAEWSVAVGLNESPSGSPQEKDAKIPGVYPWGSQWPPPGRAANFADATAKRSFSKLTTIQNYDDGYATAAPVGRFAANRPGLHDLGGNVWEWCEDFYDGKGGNRVMRGGSWYNHESRYLLSSSRYHQAASTRFWSVGFRCVLEVRE